MKGSFVVPVEDFDFICARKSDGTCIWSKREINAPEATAELIDLEDVPAEALRAFAEAEVRARVQHISTAK